MVIAGGLPRCPRAPAGYQDPDSDWAKQDRPTSGRNANLPLSRLSHVTIVDPFVPPANKPTGEQLDAALARLNELPDDAQLIDDQHLSELLEPFRGHRPLKMICPRTGCGGTIVWCALHPSWAFVVASKNGPRKGYVRKLNKQGPPSWLGPQPPEPYNYWSLGPSPGGDSATPASQGDGMHTRWSFKCRKCQRGYTVTNRTLIRRTITAITGNSREFTP